MSVKRAFVWTSAAAALAVLSGCSSSSTPTQQAAAGQPTTSAPTASAGTVPGSGVSSATGSVVPSTAASSTPATTGISTSAVPAVADVQKLNPAAWPAPAQLPLNDTYQWAHPDTLHYATSTPDQNGGLYWLSACQDKPTVFATGWKGSQEAQYAPTKNYAPSGHEPGFTAPWSAIGIMLVFTDAKSAGTAFTAIEQANDGCAARMAGLHEPANFSEVKRVASISTGQSWWLAAPGNTEFDMHAYAVQRGPFIMLLRVDKDTQGFSQVPTYTGGSDGGADTAVLTDIADHLCGYAGACQ